MARGQIGFGRVRGGGCEGIYRCKYQVLGRVLRRLSLRLSRDESGGVCHRGKGEGTIVGAMVNRMRCRETICRMGSRDSIGGFMCLLSRRLKVSNDNFFDNVLSRCVMGTDYRGDCEGTTEAMARLAKRDVDRATT